MRALVATIIVLCACHQEPKHAIPTIYELPNGFTGWVTVEYAVPAAAALPEERGARVIRIPPDARLQTSSPQWLGIVDNRFYFVDGTGRRTPIDDREATPDAAPNEAGKSHDHPVVLRFETGDMTDATGRHVFERFYVGLGPAGEPPGWR
ncbi:MAG TPA: hypothetical protein VHN14_11595 [Kofleriaceae bacterium]|jgi:hypothetical protein|nr:hypothetical protein [Kofleriaceae bacterium]